MYDLIITMTSEEYLKYSELLNINNSLFDSNFDKN